MGQYLLLQGESIGVEVANVFIHACRYDLICGSIVLNSPHLLSMSLDGANTLPICGIPDFNSTILTPTGESFLRKTADGPYGLRVSAESPKNFQFLSSPNDNQVVLSAASEVPVG